MPKKLAKDTSTQDGTKGGYSCAADHAERLLHTDYGAYLDWYSPKGRKAKEIKRPNQ